MHAHVSLFTRHQVDAVVQILDGLGDFDRIHVHIRSGRRSRPGPEQVHWQEGLEEQRGLVGIPHLDAHFIDHDRSGGQGEIACPAARADRIDRGAVRGISWGQMRPAERPGPDAHAPGLVGSVIKGQVDILVVLEDIGCIRAELRCQ